MPLKRPEPKSATSSDGRPMHFSVGALISRNGKYLLIDRVNVPYGYAGLAGHVDEGETPDSALLREVAEESGLAVTSRTLLFEEEIRDNVCSRGIPVHYFYLYVCETEGEPKLDPEEAHSIGWYSAAELRTLPLEPVWEHWFKKIGVI